MIVRSAIVVLGIAFAATFAERAEAGKPNVVIILADDLGYGDVHCNNPTRSKIPTPNLDRIAAEGMRFTDAHSSSGVCSPSRYALLTGRYHWRTRLQTGIVNPWEVPLIAPDRLTVASLAKRQGYRTAAFGKWHLGWDWPIPTDRRKLFSGYARTDRVVDEAGRAAWREVFGKPIPGGPTTRGFDRYFGTDVPNWPPFCFIEDDRTRGIPSELLSADLMTRKNQASIQGPALPGWSFEPILPALVEHARAFIEESAPRPEPYLLYLPLTTPHTPLAVNAAWKDKSGLDNPCADLIMETDAAVGQVLAAVDRSGEKDDTLVLFTSDNGFAMPSGPKQLEARGHFPSGPLRGYKTEAYEGGHREPFIVRWPKVVKPGSVRDQLVHQADVLATFAEILETPLPADAGEDSFSFLSVLKGGEGPTREHAVSCAANGVPAIRLGAWKLILASDPSRPAGPPVQLYDLSKDLGETTNLAAERPEQVIRMKALYDQLVEEGRSTPGPKRQNDVPVIRFPKSAARPAAKKPT